MNKKIKPILSFESDIHPHHCKQFVWIHDGQSPTPKGQGILAQNLMKHPENNIT